MYNCGQVKLNRVAIISTAKKLELKWDNIQIRVRSDNNHCVVRT